MEGEEYGEVGSDGDNARTVLEGGYSHLVQ